MQSFDYYTEKIYILFRLEEGLDRVAAVLKKRKRPSVQQKIQFYSDLSRQGKCHRRYRHACLKFSCVG